MICLTGNDFLEDSPYEPVNSRLSDISLLAPIMGKSEIWIPSIPPLCFVSDRFWLTFDPSMHPTVLCTLRLCSFHLFLSNCSIHSHGCMRAWGAVVPCPTKPVASDVGGGLFCHHRFHKIQFRPLVVRVQLLRWVSERVSGEWQALLCSHLRVGVMLTQTSRWWCYSLFHNHLVALWLSQVVVSN